MGRRNFSVHRTGSQCPLVSIDSFPISCHTSTVCIPYSNVDINILRSTSYTYCKYIPIPHVNPFTKFISLIHLPIYVPRLPAPLSLTTILLPVLFLSICPSDDAHQPATHSFLAYSPFPYKNSHYHTLYHLTHLTT